MHTSFMPAIGIGQACATLVGKYLGEENSNKAELSIYESIRGSLYIMGVMGLILSFFLKVSFQYLSKIYQLLNLQLLV